MFVYIKKTFLQIFMDCWLKIARFDLDSLLTSSMFICTRQSRTHTVMRYTWQRLKNI